MENKKRTRVSAEPIAQPLRTASAFFRPDGGTLNRLIGREPMLFLVQDMLQRPEVRLVTLAGPAGVGKTRLAQQLLLELEQVFPDGVIWIPLAASQAAAQVLPQALQALGVTPAEDGSYLEQLHLVLQDTSALLVLDNFEQVVDAAPDLTALLAMCPGLKMLVTSRAVLRVQGEQVVVVPPLGLPEQHHLADVERVRESHAVALLVERAQQARHDFALTSANAASMAEICIRLDGLPLALELAAPRLALFSPALLLERLKQRLEVIGGGGPDRPKRHQTLRAALAWSYDLLTPQEQQLFRHLAVFASPFSLEAVEALGSLLTCPPSSLFDEMVALLNQSLLRRVESPDGTPRFYLLETVREYALELLLAAGELARARNAHAAYYLAFAEAEDQSLLLPPPDARWQRLLQEYLNLKAALEWLLEQQELEAAFRLAVAARAVWSPGARISDGQRLLRHLLEAGEKQPVSLALRAQVLTTLGHLALWTGDLSQGAHAFEAALRLFEQEGDSQSAATVLLYLGIMEHQQEPSKSANDLMAEGLRRCREMASPAEIAYALFALGHTALFAGQFAQAEQWCGESLQQYQKLDNPWGIAANLHYLGWSAACQGDHAQACALEEESIARFQAMGNPAPVMEALVVLASERIVLNDAQGARFLLDTALELGRTGGNSIAVARARWGLGHLAQHQGEWEAAQALYQESLRMLLSKPRPTRIRWMIAASLEGLAAISATKGLAEAAVVRLSAAQALRAANGMWNPAGYDQRLAEHTSALARATLDEAAFGMLWARGQMLSPAQALAAEGSGQTHAAPVAIPAASAPAPRAAPQDFTIREMEVLRLLAEGLSDKEMAARLMISPYTVNSHVQALYRKLGVHSRSAATHAALTQNLL
jgi:predicted ATPase/DNA-binding NarL/FixJ family response regulator